MLLATSLLTLVGFRLEHLARGLVLELVVLAQETAAETALEHAPAVLPHAYKIILYERPNRVTRVAPARVNCKLLWRDSLPASLCHPEGEETDLSRTRGRRRP